jgi:hypothetical protein
MVGYVGDVTGFGKKVWLLLRWLWLCTFFQQRLTNESYYVFMPLARTFTHDNHDATCTRKNDWFQFRKTQSDVNA